MELMIFPKQVTLSKLSQMTEDLTPSDPNTSVPSTAFFCYEASFCLQGTLKLNLMVIWTVLSHALFRLRFSSCACIVLGVKNGRFLKHHQAQKHFKLKRRHYRELDQHSRARSRCQNYPRYLETLLHRFKQFSTCIQSLFCSGWRWK